MRLFPLGIGLVACGWLLTGAACNPKLLVPPARAMGGESPAALPAGAVSAGMTFSGLEAQGLYDDNPFFTSRIIAGDLTGGLGLDLDARLTATFASMAATHPQDEYVDFFEEARLDKDLRAASLRVKWNPAGNRFLAVSGGGGYGSWAGRGYYSAEGALLFGFENPYFVPYLNYRASYNVPLRRDSVRWSGSPYWDSYAKYTIASRSQEWILGFKIPIKLYEGPRDPARDRNPPYFALEFGTMDIEDSEDGFSGLMIGGGLHIPLRQSAD